jgi:hypothetical protein
MVLSCCGDAAAVILPQNAVENGYGMSLQRSQNLLYCAAI